MQSAQEGKPGKSNPLPLLLLAATCTACSPTNPTDTTSLIANLNKKIPATIAAGNAPSTQVAVIQGNRIIWSKAFGENTGVDRVYMNASVQKTFTAAAVLQLVEAGLIDLDADVGEYVPFPVRHPEFPETPITVRMLLAHRSGLDDFPYQFAWDTESSFAPRFRPACPDDLSDMTLEEFLGASLDSEGANYDPGSWIREPGRDHRYSVSAYPLLRYVVGRVTGSSYAAYLRENIFTPLEMTSSGFTADEFAGRHAIPYTRIDGENVELPLWNGRASLMHTTAADMAKFMLALMHEGRSAGVQLLQPETVELMRRRTTRFKVLFQGGDDLPRSGRGLGHSILRGGWFGIGGSTPGYQCLFRFHPDRKVGFVLLTNVNAILGGGHNYASARGEIYAVQDALVSVLDPTYAVRRRAGEIGIVGALVLYLVGVAFWMRSKKKGNTMSGERQTAELVALLKQTGEAHHQAFAATDGEDEDWAIWYADYLHDRLMPFLAAPIERSRIVCCLMATAEEHETADPDAPWPEFYAARILECLGPAKRPAEDRLALYHFDGCPYCSRVRHVIDELGIDVELRDIFENHTYLEELKEARGRRTVPVLRIIGAEGDDRWMPESADIVRYLDATYGQSETL